LALEGFRTTRLPALPPEKVMFWALEDPSTILAVMTRSLAAAPSLTVKVRVAVAKANGEARAMFPLMDAPLDEEVSAGKGFTVVAPVFQTNRLVPVVIWAEVFPCSRIGAPVVTTVGRIKPPAEVVTAWTLVGRTLVGKVSPPVSA